VVLFLTVITEAGVKIMKHAKNRQGKIAKYPEFDKYAEVSHTQSIVALWYQLLAAGHHLDWGFANGRNFRLK